jgi:electron transfer flavoprotein alpha subunit
VGIWGGEVAGAANALASCGAARFLGVAGPEFAPSRYVTDAAAAEALVRAASPSLVIAPATARVRRALPGVAGRVGGRVDTGIGAIESDGDRVTVRRWTYRQRIRVTQTRKARPWFLVVDTGLGEAWDGPAGDAALESVPVDVGALPVRTKVVGIEAASKAAQTIRPDAELLFVAGAGWTKKQPDGMAHPDDAARRILGFLEATGASLGSSKSLVDQSSEGEAVLPFMSHLNQVGQTGSTPRHPKGLATCCHGEEPHVVGWRFIRERRAVNLDPACGWAQGKADVLYVADAFEVMEKVNARLAARAGATAEG